jgi:hypothetical protein
MESLTRLVAVLRPSSTALLLGIIISIPALIPAQPTYAVTGDLVGPSGSGVFGTTVTMLANGNFVVTDPGYDAGTVVNVGAVYLYNGATHALISTLTGSRAEDRVGSEGITALSNGNYVVASPDWNNGGIARAGAVTWGSGSSGVAGVVSSSNSLVGSTASDEVGSRGVTALTNGNYVVRSTLWDNGSTVNAGAVTWGNGLGGTVGAVSSSNSLVGSTTEDQVGGSGISTLTNGNYVVRSSGWNNGSTLVAGAVTWGNGLGGTVGAVSSSNSLVGSSPGDAVGSGYITMLSNGNYLVSSPGWDNGGITSVGAVTWGNGTSGITGTINSSNSLVGSSPGDAVGSGYITMLSNGNYVVRSPDWDNESIINAGAITWGNGTTGTTGVVSSSNSLVGSSPGDLVGSVTCNSGITALSNGNYVVSSPYWNNGSIGDVGAATWGNGTIGITGTISSSNSLVGSSPGDAITCDAVLRCVGAGYGITALSNGHYVVRSPNWNNGGIARAGAVTWGNGTTGTTGVVSSTNSLVGSSTEDRVGLRGITALSNGHYVVASPNWNNGGISDAGAATWGNGTTGITGTISSNNSLVGSSPGDAVAGSRFIRAAVGSSITALSNGNYIVNSPDWDNGGVPDAGAVTWGSGTTGITGIVSSSNSLVGSSAADQVGGILALTNGNYVVGSSGWDNGGVPNAGAVTWGNGTSGVIGVVSSSNSLVGSSAEDRVGSRGITALSNGNYVVSSSGWDNGGVPDAGAVTWGSGTMGMTGAVSSSNSLVGTSTSDQVGLEGITTLTNGNYVVRSPDWNNGGIARAGAVTWGSGTMGMTGAVSSSNSLVGSSAEDRVGSRGIAPGWKGITALSDGNYVVNSLYWDNGDIIDAGAATWGNGSMTISGTVASNPSISGMRANRGSLFTIPVFEPINGFVVVGIRSENRVAFLQRPTITTLTPPPGRVQSFYLHAFTATGAPDPTFTLQRGSTLPPGLTLPPSGVLSGFPTASGTFTFTVVASNGIPPSVSQAFTLVIEPRPTETPWQTWFPLSMR